MRSPCQQKIILSISVSINTAGMSKEIPGSVTPWITYVSRERAQTMAALSATMSLKFDVMLDVPVIDRDEHSLDSQAELSL